jgi:hypothetical protein
MRCGKVPARSLGYASKARHGTAGARREDVEATHTLRKTLACRLLSQRLSGDLQPYNREAYRIGGFPLARSYELTLLDLIQAVSEVAANDQETLATVIDLINNSGRVRLRRDAGRAMIDLLMKADAAA